MLTVILALGCAAETNLSNTGQDVNEVEGAGILTYSPEIMIWEDLEVGLTSGQTLTINSVGELNLVVKQARLIDSANGQFYMEETEDKTIGPGNSLDIAVVATLNKDKSITGTLRVETNDLDHISFDIPLEAHPIGANTADSGDPGDSGDPVTDSGDPAPGDSGAPE